MLLTSKTCKTTIGGYMSSLTIRLPDEIDNRLNQLSKRTHRTKSFYVREAILSYLEDLEDTYDALKVLKEPGKNYSMAEVVRDLNLTEEELKDIGMGD